MEHSDSDAVARTVMHDLLLTALVAVVVKDRKAFSELLEVLTTASLERPQIVALAGYAEFSTALRKELSDWMGRINFEEHH